MRQWKRIIMTSYFSYTLWKLFFFDIYLSHRESSMCLLVISYIFVALFIVNNVIQYLSTLMTKGKNLVVA